MGELTFSIKEAAVLARTTEKAIRNDIQRDVISPLRKDRKIALRASTVYYLRLINEIPVSLNHEFRAGLYTILTRGNVKPKGWRVAGDDISFSDVTLNTAKIHADFERDLEVYKKGLENIASHNAVLGGEPVFAGTRISVRHIGRMADRDVPIEEIQADYPSLTADDIRFAQLYSRMKPGPGRPHKLKFRHG
jgi:uncharacterized protein (DUF433 family)